MKKNILCIIFMQLIPARQVKVKKDGVETGEIKNIEARTNEISFTQETDREVRAGKLAEWYVVQFRNFLKLMQLQGKQSFQTSKAITVAMRLTERLDNGTERVKELTGETKMSINIDRIENCLTRNENFVALLEQVHNAPKFGASTAIVKAFLTNASSNVLLLSSKAEAKKEVVAEDAVLVETQAN